MTKTITITTGLLTLALAIISFILSFNALTDLAAQHGISIPPLFPFVVEAAVVVFSVAMLYWSLQNERTRWLWTLIIGSSVIAGTFNVIHAQPDIVSQSMSAMPSLFLLLSFETFLSLVKHRAKFSGVVQSLTTLTAECQAVESELSAMRQALKRKREQLSAEIVFKTEADNVNMTYIRAAKDDDITSRRLALVGILSTQGDIGPTALAEELTAAGWQCSRGTVYNDLKSLDADGVVFKNGNGWGIKS